MLETTVEEVEARLDAALAKAGAGAVAFDGDGTLWSGDVGDDFFHAFVARGELRPEAEEPLRALARSHGVAHDGSPRELLGRLLEAFEKHAFDEALFYEVTAWLCAGWRRSDVEAFVAGVVGASRLEARLHGEAVRVLETARRRGLAVRIVSASPCPVVVAAARAVGVEAQDVVAVRPRYDGDVMVADVERPVPYGRGKVEALQENLGAVPLLAAFGDNRFDVDLLVSAQIPVAVRPKARLRDAAHLVPGLVALRPVDFPGCRH